MYLIRESMDGSRLSRLGRRGDREWVVGREVVVMVVGSVAVVVRPALRYGWMECREEGILKWEYRGPVG